MRLALLALATSLAAQTTVSLTLHANTARGPLRPITAFFGYDEPNYTYSPSGAALIARLASFYRAPVSFRTHFLLATGDGVPSPKWGSTNVYTEDPSGRPVYNWTILDRIFSTWLDAGAQPFVEVGFMPQALSSHPEPYRPIWSPGASFDHYFTGWTYPPSNDAKWSALIREWVLHEVSLYGRARVATWSWEVWNEPDIAYWHGTPAEYNHLYDLTAAAIRAALPEARVGGPASTGPSSPRAGAFLRQFLEHVSATGAPLDFVSFHAKGRTSMEGPSPRMDLAKQLADVEAGLKILAAFPRLCSLPIVLSESDPEGCAACSARFYPQNAYRNSSRFAAYTAAAWGGILDLASRYHANVEGMLTWAFEFENQPWFSGFRTLSTHGVDKPVINFFRMAGLMGPKALALDKACAPPSAPPACAGISAVASRSESTLSILVWNYRDTSSTPSPARVSLTAAGLPEGLTRVLLRHYRVDARLSNSYSAWLALGSPQYPTPAQYSALAEAGRLHELHPPVWLPSRPDATLAFDLPEDAVSLLQLSW